MRGRSHVVVTLRGARIADRYRSPAVNNYFSFFQNNSNLLFCFGGVGPPFAIHIARSLEMTRIVQTMCALSSVLIVVALSGFVGYAEAASDCTLPNALGIGVEGVSSFSYATACVPGLTLSTGAQCQVQCDRLSMSAGGTTTFSCNAGVLTPATLVCVRSACTLPSPLGQFMQVESTHFARARLWMIGTRM